MWEGLLSGFLWGLDTVILGVALAMSPFVSTEQAIFLAPFISTFIHDLCSSLIMIVYMGVKKQFKKVIRALKTKSGKFIALAAILAGPVGMTGYVLSIKYIGAAYTAVISSIFPAVGALLAYIFLKEKMKIYQLIGLAASIIGIIGLGYTPGSGEMGNVFIGFLCAFICVFGWASEAVIIAYGLKDPDISDEEALLIRQFTSAVFYGIIILPIVGAWRITVDILPTSTSAIIFASALFGTTSYLFYYKSINKIGASKAMALNITYSAWAMVFGYLFLREAVYTKDAICALVIIVGSIVAGSNIKDFFKFNRAKDAISRKKA